MAEPKTKPTTGTLEDWLSSVDEARRADATAIAELMARVVGEPGKMWGATIAGFGTWHYRYASGTEADWMIVGFSVRKSDLTLYVLGDFPERDALLAGLGKHKTGKSCLYLKKLADVDLGVLEQIVRRSATWVREQHPHAH
ncbi:MAG: DUF1801 domain-containing protein [Deltaproteobacteria bacterium]|nr:DUF1801 domain-containing protein [Deltaproteobacteria bacterium]